MTTFDGIWVPIITPFHNNEIDFASLRALAGRLAAAGVSGLVACGSTGEAAALDEDEQLAVLDTLLETVSCPVAMGLSSSNLQDALRRMDTIQRRPVAGLLVPPPSYIRPGQEGVANWFTALADAAQVPLILYNIPYRTGTGIAFETYRRLETHSKVIATKDCGGDAALTMNLIAQRRLQVLAGEDLQVLSTLALGGSGAILASAHIRPDLFVRLAAHVRNGELNEAREVFYRLLPMIQLLFAEPNPGPLKAALATMGWVEDAALRSPMVPPSEGLRERIASELRRLECL